MCYLRRSCVFLEYFSVCFIIGMLIISQSTPALKRGKPKSRAHNKQQNILPHSYVRRVRQKLITAIPIFHVGLFPIHTVFLANKEINQEKVTIRWLYQSYQSEWAYKAVRLFQFKDPYFTDHILYFIFKGI